MRSDNILFGQDQGTASEDRRIRVHLEIMRLATAPPHKKECVDDPDKLDQHVREAIHAELKRLVDLYAFLSAHEIRKVEANARAACIPSQEVGDCIMRNGVRLSRKFDKNLRLLELVQWMRKGEPLSPQVDVKIS